MQTNNKIYFRFPSTQLIRASKTWHGQAQQKLCTPSSESEPNRSRFVNKTTRPKRLQSDPLPYKRRHFKKNRIFAFCNFQ